MGNEKLKRIRGLANLSQELLIQYIVVQNYRFGVNLILNQNTPIEQSITLIQCTSLKP